MTFYFKLVKESNSYPLKNSIEIAEIYQNKIAKFIKLHSFKNIEN